MTAPTDAMNPEETLARWRAEEAAGRMGAMKIDVGPEACSGATQGRFGCLFNFGLATLAICPERPL